MKPMLVTGYGVGGREIYIDAEKVYMWRTIEYNGIVGTEVYLHGQSDPIAIAGYSSDFTKAIKALLPGRGE